MKMLQWQIEMFLHCVDTFSSVVDTKMQNESNGDKTVFYLIEKNMLKAKSGINIASYLDLVSNKDLLILMQLA